MPRAAVILPARDMGWPYFARFSGVSGTGPLVVIDTVTLVGTPAAVAEVVVLVVVVAPVVVVDDEVVAEADGSAEASEAAGAGWSG